MRILFVTWTEKLLEKLSALNPELEICAIVTDEVEEAEKILESVGWDKNLIHPLYELKECAENFYYDYILCTENFFWAREFTTILREYGVPKEKIISLNFFCGDNFFVERVLRYFEEHAAEFEIFATGISYTEVGLDITRFKKKIFNFGHSSQDLYYNFQCAKRAVLYGGGHSKILYALIGLAPYIFHYDQSKAWKNHFNLSKYFIAFGDLHNFHLPAEIYKKFLRDEYFETKLPLEPFDLNNPFYAKNPLRFMGQKERLAARKYVEDASNKYFPETREENIKIMDEYLTLCEENKIRPVMFLPPMTECYKKYFNRQMLDEFHYLIRQACKKHSTAIFIDSWKVPGFVDADFYDAGHMNLNGAAKFSEFLNFCIEQLDSQGG